MMSGDNIIYQIARILDIENGFVLAYPQRQTGSEIYQNKTQQFSSKTHWKTTKVWDESIQFLQI